MSTLDQQRHNYLMASLKFGYGQEQSTNLVSNIRLVLIPDNHNHKLACACVKAYSQSNMFFIVTIVALSQLNKLIEAYLSIGSKGNHLNLCAPIQVYPFPAPTPPP